MTPKDRLIVALDVPTAEAAWRLVDSLSGLVGMFKVGSSLFTKTGPDFVRNLIGRGEKVFLDLKYHDIPHAVGNAVAAACQLGVSLIDVHALGGAEMLDAAVSVLPATGTRLLAVTILTSHDTQTLHSIGIRESPEVAVRRLALLAYEHKLDGVVASPQEVGLIREACGSHFTIVTPGIRPTGASPRDQARTATPALALAAGADYLVIGRPITESQDPASAAAQILQKIGA